jgi:hypothetical protein
MTGQRNRFTFFVTWPDDVEPPTPCPKSYRVWYPTRDAMTLAAQGYLDAGAVVSA